MSKLPNVSGGEVVGAFQNLNGQFHDSEAATLL